MLNKIFLFTFLFFMPCIIQAQLNIKGQVVMIDEQPLVGANVILLNGDSLVIEGCSTTDEGKFILKNIKEQDNRLRISCVGYIPVSIKLYTGKKNLDIGKITLLPDTVGLDEVVVKNNNQLQAIDRQIIFPTAQQIRYSTNGVTLLQQLGLNGLIIDLANNKVNHFSKGEVQFCVNGKPVSKAEVIAIRPEDIQRVEYYDRFSARYGGTATINYILEIKERGGVVAVDLTNEPFMAQGDNQIVAKANHNQSEWGVLYNWSYMDVDVGGKKYNTYRFPDRVVERNEEIIKDEMKNQNHKIILNYNTRKEKAYYFNATWTTDLYLSPFSNTSGLIETSGESSLLSVNDSIYTRTHLYSLDLYFQKDLKNNQQIVYNLVGTYADGRDEKNTFYWKDNLLQTALQQRIENEKYSLIGQVYYEKSWKSARWAAGIKYMWNKLNNHYKEDVVQNYGIQYNRAELNTTLTGQKGKWGYSCGGSVQYNRVSGDNPSRYFTYSLEGALQYGFTQNRYIAYQLSIGRMYPSLSSLNDVEVFVNDMERQRGNSALRPYQGYNQKLTFYNKINWFYYYVEGGYSYLHRPLMDETLYENGYFIRTKANQRGFHNISLGILLGFNIWKDYLKISIIPGWINSASLGNAYLHRRSEINYRAELTGMYKNWMVQFQLFDAYKTLMGETLNGSSNWDRLLLTYQYKTLAFSAGISGFLGRDYRSNWQGNCSELASYSSWNMGVKNVVFFKLSYTLPFGKQRYAIEQKIQNRDGRDGMINHKK